MVHVSRTIDNRVSRKTTSRCIIIIIILLLFIITRSRYHHHYDEVANASLFRHCSPSDFRLIIIAAILVKQPRLLTTPHSNRPSLLPLFHAHTRTPAQLFYTNYIVDRVRVRVPSSISLSFFAVVPTFTIITLDWNWLYAPIYTVNTLVPSVERQSRCLTSFSTSLHSPLH